MTAPDPSQYPPAGAPAPQFGPAGAPAPAPKKATGIYIRLADLIVAAGALIIVLFSWAPVVGFSDSVDNGEIGRSLWTWLSPLGLFVLVAALGLIATAAVDTWWHRDKPMVGLHRHHVQVGVAVFALLVVFGMCFADPYDVSGLRGSSIGFGVSYGGIIQLLGALVAAVGAVLNFFNQLQNPIGVPSVSVSQPPAYHPQQPQGPQGYPQQPPAGSYPPPQQPMQQPPVPPQQPNAYPQAGTPTMFDPNPGGTGDGGDRTQPLHQPPTTPNN
jgi:hypothetical protein